MSIWSRIRVSGRFGGIIELGHRITDGVHIIRTCSLLTLLVY